MNSSGGNIRRRIVVLLVGAVAGGLYGLLQVWPADWALLVITIIGNGLLWGGVAYFAFVWLRPRKTRGTLIGAVIGAVIALVTFLVFPSESSGPYSGIAAISKNIVAGVAAGALVGTAPRGALIGAGIGAIVVSLLAGVYLAIGSWTRGYEYNWVIVFVGATITGLLFGGGIGAYLELSKRGKVSKPHP